MLAQADGPTHTTHVYISNGPSDSPPKREGGALDFEPGPWRLRVRGPVLEVQARCGQLPRCALVDGRRTGLDLGRHDGMSSYIADTANSQRSCWGVEMLTCRPMS